MSMHLLSPTRPQDAHSCLQHFAVNPPRWTVDPNPGGNPDPGDPPRKPIGMTKSEPSLMDCSAHKRRRSLDLVSEPSAVFESSSDTQPRRSAQHPAPHLRPFEPPQDSTLATPGCQRLTWNGSLGTKDTTLAPTEPRTQTTTPSASLLSQTIVSPLEPASYRAAPEAGDKRAVLRAMLPESEGEDEGECHIRTPVNARGLQKMALGPRPAWGHPASPPENCPTPALAFPLEWKGSADPFPSYRSSPDLHLEVAAATAVESVTAAAVVPPPTQPVPSRYIILTVIGWYASSMGITALNKHLFDTLQFNYPILVTLVHFAAVSFFLSLCFACSPRCCGTPPVISRRTYITSVIPISFLSAVEIGLSNLAYPAVSISVMTVVKSSIVVVTYVLSVLARLENFSGRLFSIVMFIFFSICLTVPGMNIQNKAGVVMLCGAVLAASVRWILVHEQLQFKAYTPLQLMFLTQPFCTMWLALPAWFLDIRRFLLEDENRSSHIITVAFLLVCITVALAFSVVLTEFYLVRMTSSVSLTVAGIGKEAATILMSRIIFNEVLSLRTAIGIGASVIGIMGYSHLRYTKNAFEGT